MATVLTHKTHARSWRSRESADAFDEAPVPSGRIRAGEFSVPKHYRVTHLKRRRAERILAMNIEFMPSSSFELSSAGEKILGPYPKSDSKVHQDHCKAKLPVAPPGTPPYLASLYSIPLLTPEQEQYLFRKMNFLKYQAHRLRDSLDPNRQQMALMDRIEELLDDALLVRNQIVCANLRLVVSMAKTHVDSANQFDEIVSDGNLPLIRAAEIFDFERGTRFSTYATWAVRNSLFRSTPRNRLRMKRFPTMISEVFESTSEDCPSMLAQETYHRNLRSAIEQMLSKLDNRDQTIVSARFGLDKSGRPQRLREIAERLNISTERVRQLLTRSLNRMRELIEIETVEVV